MINQFSNQSLAMGKAYADTIAKAQSLTMESFERIAALQMQTFENRMAAAMQFWSEAAEVRDLEGAKAFWPKTVELTKDNAEKIYSTSQDVLGVSVKTGEALGELAKESLDAAAANVTKPAASKTGKSA